jgi:hypothetical protein
MAWREVLARAMEGFQCQENVSPDWLVNPATKRRLKLDQLYPEVGLAVRFVGVTAKGQPRQSDWEELEEQQRDQTRAELCRAHGVELFLVDVDHAHPQEQLLQLRTILSRLSRLLAQSRRPDKEKSTLMPRLAEARARLDQATRRVHSADDLALYAELWRDRETSAAAAMRAPAAPRPQPQGKLRVYQPAQAVQHATFGPGTVVSVNSGDDPQITVLFADGRERTFLASLVSGKLTPAG